MRSRGRMVFLISFGLLLAAGIVYAVTHPVLLRISEGPLPADRRVLLLSPFRDREPEKIAERFLDRLKRGECQGAIGSLGWSVEKRSLICDREVANPLVSLRLIDISEEEGVVTLRYLWHGPSPERLGSFMQVQVGGERGNRRVVDYDRSY
jgi:hypothetical protein